MLTLLRGENEVASIGAHVTLLHGITVNSCTLLSFIVRVGRKGYEGCERKRSPKVFFFQNSRGSVSKFLSKLLTRSQWFNNSKTFVTLVDIRRST